MVPGSWVSLVGGFVVCCCGGCLSVWRWGCMPGGASRGRACARREALGRKGFRAARWGRKGVRLQCSLRPGPAGARWLGWCWGWGRCGGGCSVCAGSVGCRFVWDGSVGLAMGLCAWWGFAGSGLRSQGGSGEEGLSRCALGNKGCSPPMLAPTRPRGRPSWCCFSVAGS